MVLWQSIRESASTEDYTLNKFISPSGGSQPEKGENMKLQDLIFERIEHYDPLNSRAKKNGIVSEWVARDSWGNAVAFGSTKAECLQDARRYIALKNL